MLDDDANWLFSIRTCTKSIKTSHLWKTNIFFLLIVPQLSSTMGQCLTKEPSVPVFATPMIEDSDESLIKADVVEATVEKVQAGEEEGETQQQQQPTKPRVSSQQQAPTGIAASKSQLIAQVSTPSAIDTAQLTTIYRVPDSKYGTAEDVLKDRGLVLLDMFDEGGFAKVYKACRQSGNGAVKQMMACKVVDIGLDLSDSTKLADVKNELFVFEKVKHPHIVRMYEHFVVNEYLYIFMDYADMGNLYRFMYLHQGAMAETEAKRPFSQIVSGVAYMHAQKIAHRDLKLSNILLKTLPDGSIVILIADFGLSRVVYRRRSGLLACKSYCGTPNYMAPELKHRQHYNAFDIDMYALGVMLFVLLQGCYPFDAKDDEKALAQAEKEDIQWTREAPLSKAARTLLIALMQPSASKRMSMRQLISEKWFAEEMASIAHILPPVDMLPKKLATRRFSSPKDDVRIRGRKSSAGISTGKPRVKSSDGLKQHSKKFKSADASSAAQRNKSIKSTGGGGKSPRSRPKSTQKVSSRVSATKPRSAENRSKSAETVSGKQQGKSGKMGKAAKTSNFSSTCAFRQTGRHSKG